MKTHGIVVFFEPDYATKTIKEINRTPAMEWFYAVNVYAETPNPASQMIEWDEAVPGDKLAATVAFEKIIRNKEWLEHLFECI